MNMTEKQAPTLTITPERVKDMRERLAADGTLPAAEIKNLIDQYEHLNTVVAMFNHEPVIVRERLWDLEKLTDMYRAVFSAIAAQFGTLKIEERHFGAGNSFNLQKDSFKKQYILKKVNE
jgi:hypothetical protein